MAPKSFKMTMPESMWNRIAEQAEAQEKLPTELIRDLLRRALRAEGVPDV